jgi:hypothetical protein
MASHPDVEKIQSDYAELLKQIAARREQQKKALAATRKLRQDVRNVSRKFDAQLTDRLSKTERTALQKDAATARQLMKSSLEKMKRTLRPPANKQRTQQLALRSALQPKKQSKFPEIQPPPWINQWLQWVEEHSIRHGQLSAPAYGCANTEGETNISCFPDTGLLKLSYDITGDGWGWEAQAEPGTLFVGLVFIYFPRIEGILSATANMHLVGNVLVHAVDQWWSSSHADCDFELVCGITQGTTQLAWNSTPVVKQDRGDSTFFQAFDEVLQAPCTAYVLPETTIYITVGATAFADAASEYDTVDIDFASHDPEKYLLVESVDISLDPAT